MLIIIDENEPVQNPELIKGWMDSTLKKARESNVEPIFILSRFHENFNEI